MRGRGHERAWACLVDEGNGCGRITDKRKKVEEGGQVNEISLQRKESQKGCVEEGRGCGKVIMERIERGEGG